MSFVRPEVRDGLMRWREVLVGAVTLGLGLRLASTSFGAIFIIGCGLAITGAATVSRASRPTRAPITLMSRPTGMAER